MVRYLFLKFVFLAGMLSFLLQFVWEWFQCEPFFVHRGTQASPISMVMAAIGDVVLTFLVLGFVFILTKRRQTFMQSNFQFRNFVLIEVTAFLAAVGIEKLALATNRWSYTYINPIIPILGVSILPVLQLMLIVPLVLFVTVAVLRRALKRAHQN